MSRPEPHQGFTAPSNTAAPSFPRVRRAEIYTPGQLENIMKENMKAPKKRSGKRSFRSRHKHPRTTQPGQNDLPQPIQNDHAQPDISPVTPKGIFETLDPLLLKALSHAGYEHPTEIQAAAIPRMLEGSDLIGSAQTGTGKTAAFVLPLLQQLMKENIKPPQGTPRALILAPTRELASQIGDSVSTYGRFTHISQAVIYGGVPQRKQVSKLSRSPEILVATPGRLLDLIQQGHIDLSRVEFFILDEVDRMLDMGFMPDIKRILGKIPAERQTAFFSATMEPKIETLALSMVRDNPVRIAISPEKPAVEQIAQKVMFVGKKNKDALLFSVLNDTTINKAIIFTQMKHVASKMADRLKAEGILSTAIHGNKSQAARTKALAGFKNGQFRVLVATDVAARGLDVDHISHVINYDMPQEAETYIHRIGRTARGGAEGEAISFCTEEDRACLRNVEILLGKPVPQHLDHPFHCDNALNSSAPMPVLGGRGKKRSRSDSQSRGNKPHFHKKRGASHPFRKRKNSKRVPVSHY